MRIKIIKIICFCSLIIMCSAYLMDLLCFKYPDGILQMKYFYKEKARSLDVICLGSSHTFCNISTKTLWDEYGIASYDLAGSEQPFWNTYFFLKEALQYQKPKLILLDVYRAVETREYVDHSRIIKNTLGISSLYNRMYAIEQSAPRKTRIHYWLEYPTYHKRYALISKGDFAPQFCVEDYYNEKTLTVSKGMLLFTHANKQAMPELVIPSSGRMLSSKTEDYLMKIIELCKENCIPLLFCVTPYAGDNLTAEEYYATVKEIACGHGISFVNFNHHYADMDLDFSKDVADSGHLNYHGIAKFTRHLGNYLKAHYDLPDHRGEKEYSSYEMMSNVLQWKIDNYELSETKDILTFLDRIKEQQERYLMIVGVKGSDESILRNPLLCEKLEAIGCSVGEANKNNVWVINGGTCIYYGDGKQTFDWHLRINSGFVRVYCDVKGGDISCNLNRKISKFTSHGLSFVIYDKKMEYIIDCAGFVMQNGVIKKQKLKTNAA